MGGVDCGGCIGGGGCGCGCFSDCGGLGVLVVLVWGLLSLWTLLDIVSYRAAIAAKKENSISKK